MKKVKVIREVYLSVVKNLGMYLVVEFETYENGTRFQHGVKIIPNPNHRNCNEMTYWTRDDRMEWYLSHGTHWDREVLKWQKKQKKKNSETLTNL